MSPQQRHRWRLRTRSSEPGALVTVAARVNGDVDPTRIEHALHAIVSEHEILRTVFPPAAGMKYPLQIVRASASPVFTTRSDAVVEGAQEPSWLAYEPSDGPTLQAHVRVSPTSGHLLHLALPSLTADTRSLGLLVEDVVGRCRSLGARPAGVQYADYAGWANEILDAAESVPGKEYWHNVVQPGGPWPQPLLAGPALSGAPGRYGVQPCGDQSDGCSGADDTALLAAWAILVARHCDLRHVVIGVAHHGRTQPELADAIGVFERCLPLSVDVAPNRGLLELAREIEAHYLEAQSWQDCFDETTLEHDLVASFERVPAAGALDRDGFSIVRWSPLPERSPLHLVAFDRGRPRPAEIVYDRRHYSSDAAAALAAQFADILRIVAVRPRIAVNAIAMNAVAVSAAAPVAVSPSLRPQGTILDVFERHVRERPNHPAVVSGEHVLTYGDLDRRAASVSQMLRGRGIGPGTVVPLFFDRDQEYLVALWGVLRAGAGYVPLEPAYPPARIAHILDKTRARVVLTLRTLVDRLPPTPARPLVMNDALPAAIGEPVAVGPDDTAYVIFTSGSAGAPKGVEVDHRSLLASTLAREATYRESPERLLLLASFAFDSSVAGIFWTLAGGGTVYLSPSESTKDSQQIAALIDRHRISHIQILPSLYHAVLNEAGSLTSLRAVTVAGEVCPLSLVTQHHSRLPDTALVNEYGPTESTVWSSAYVAANVRRECGDPDSGSAASSLRVPLGHAAGHVTIRIVDPELRALPTGLAGEIAIGGVGLARGYLHEPALTADRFRPDATSPAGGRIYRSGDRGFLRPDGTLEFLGRVDDQVKIRGVRVEPGEIEAALLEIDGVTEARVVTRGDGEATKLHGFVVGAAGRFVDEVPVLRALRARLPDHMVPSRVTVLPELPRTPNGKIDAAALRALAIMPLRDRPAWSAPESAAERRLAAIWQRVMRRTDVGVHDNFFDLGGDSIQILRVRTEAAKEGLRFELRQMLEHPTIAGLAAQIAASHSFAEASGPPAAFALIADEDRLALPAGVVDAYPMTRLQAHMSKQCDREPGSGLYHDVATCHLRLPVDLDAFEAALAAVVHRHPILRSSFDRRDPHRLMTCVHGKAAPTLTVVDWRTLEGAEQERQLELFLAAEPQMPFEWSRPPLVRFTVHLRSDRSCQLTWTSHHAVLDGWSATTLGSELIREYAARVGRGAPVGVAAASNPVIDAMAEYVRLERESLSSAESLAFWQRSLAGAPTGHVGKRGPRSAIRRVERTMLAASAIEALSERAREEAVPLRTVLLAAHVRALSRVTGASDVVTGLFAHARPDLPGADAALGLFLNFLPLRMRGPARTGREWIRAVADEERAIYPHRHVPVLPMAADRGDGELFDATFNFVRFDDVLDAARDHDIEILSAFSINVNEFAWNTVFRRSGEALSLETYYDPASVADARAIDIRAAVEEALDVLATTPDAGVAPSAVHRVGAAPRPDADVAQKGWI